MAPVLPADGPPVTSVTAANAPAIEMARAIARGEVGNAISGTIELPVNFKALSRLTNGAPPVTLHAFRVTGEVIRGATVSLFWKDEYAIGYVVDGVPADYPVVLAATVEPGVVVRTLVPKASRQNPARGQTIEQRSELIVIRAYLSGLIPPVGLGGTAEVVRQGGLNPAGAASANLQAVAVIEQVAISDWGRGTPEVAAAAAALRKLAQAQDGVASALRTTAPGTWVDSAVTAPVFTTTIEAFQKLEALAAKVDTQTEQGRIPASAVDLLSTASFHLEQAALADVPNAAVVAPTPGIYNLAQTPYRLQFYKALKPLLLTIYEDLGVLAFANTSYRSPNGQPFSEPEIAAAFEKGKGPYRTMCAPVDFRGTTNCKVVTNPLDRSQEVLIQRETNLFTKKLQALENAVKENDSRKIRGVLMEHPALLNFIVDDKERWNSPMGTWRMRLLQDVGADMVGGAGFPVLNDAEMFIAPPDKQHTFDDVAGISSGTFTGVLSVWMPYLDFSVDQWPVINFTSHDNLSNFAMRFDWDEEERTLLNGEIRGQRRNGADGSDRVDYSATFEGQMVDGNRVTGYWFNDERQMAGRFEMIRGNAVYAI